MKKKQVQLATSSSLMSFPLKKKITIPCVGGCFSFFSDKPRKKNVVIPQKKNKTTTTTATTTTATTSYGYTKKPKQTKHPSPNLRPSGLSWHPLLRLRCGNDVPRLVVLLLSWGIVW